MPGPGCARCCRPPKVGTRPQWQRPLPQAQECLERWRPRPAPAPALAPDLLPSPRPRPAPVPDAPARPDAGLGPQARDQRAARGLGRVPLKVQRHPLLLLQVSPSQPGHVYGMPTYVVCWALPMSPARMWCMARLVACPRKPRRLGCRGRGLWWYNEGGALAAVAGACGGIGRGGREAPLHGVCQLGVQRRHAHTTLHWSIGRAGAPGTDARTAALQQHAGYCNACMPTPQHRLRPGPAWPRAPCAFKPAMLVYPRAASPQSKQVLLLLLLMRAFMATVALGGLQDGAAAGRGGCPAADVCGADPGARAVRQEGPPAA